MFPPFAARGIRTTPGIPSNHVCTARCTATGTNTDPAAHSRVDKPQLWKAIEKQVGCRELEKMIFQLGGNANEVKPETGETPIEIAIKRRSHPSIVRLLLHAGAQVNKRVDRDGSSLLHLAAEKSTDPKVIEYLIRAGLKPSQRNSHMETPVHVAAKLNTNPQILETLLSRDSELVHKMDDEGQSALDASEKRNLNPDVSKKLVEKGGDTNLPSYDWSPIFAHSRFKWGDEFK